MKDKIVTAVGGIVLLGGITATVVLGQEVPTPIIDEEIPPIGFYLDEPEPNASNVEAKMSLLTAGGLYPDREIYVVVSKDTHPSNLRALQGFNVVMQRESITSTKEERENEMKTILPANATRFINYKEE